MNETSRLSAILCFVPIEPIVAAVWSRYIESVPFTSPWIGPSDIRSYTTAVWYSFGLFTMDELDPAPCACPPFVKS